MNIKEILLSHQKYKTFFQKNISNEFNIKKIWKKSNESKIFYNNTKSGNILLNLCTFKTPILLKIKILKRIKIVYINNE